MSESIHTVPTADDDHVCQGLMCWCVPRYYVPCDECGDLDGLSDIAAEYGVDRLHSYPDDMRAPVPGCWKCTDGLIELTVAEAEMCGQPLVNVHNR